MSRTDLRVLLVIPDYWTSEQALAVYELLEDLRERILSRYAAQITDAARKECSPLSPAERSTGPSDSD